MRNSVQKLSYYMEQKLDENEHKGGWIRERQGLLFRRIREEIVELRKAIASAVDEDDTDLQILISGLREEVHNFYSAVSSAACSNDSDGELTTEVWREAADVANFAMMIAMRTEVLQKQKKV
jgi:hypothetical protein